MYAVVLSLLVLIQFTRKTAFTMNVGSMVISGNYSDPEISENNLADGSMLLGGPASVYFGGMEFVLPDRTEQKLVSMSSDASQILFSFSDNSTIRFSTAFSGGSESMSIQAEFEEESRELEIGFRPLRSSRIIDGPDSSLSILSGEQEYGFLFGPVRVDKRTIVLNIDDTLLSYGVIPNTEEFSPASFILSSVSEQDQYQQYLQSWINQQYAQWERSMAGNPAEESVIAYIAESARRNNYRSAAASIPDTFLSSSLRSYRSAPYFGSLDVALRSLSSAERENLGRISRLANEKNPEILFEPNLVSFLTSRGAYTLLDDVAAIAQSLDPLAILPSQAAAILEGWAEWSRIRPYEENPFERLLEQSIFVLSGLFFTSDTQGTFLVDAEGRADTLMIMKAAKALLYYGQGPERHQWAALGRSLIASILNLSQQQSDVSLFMKKTEDGTKLQRASESSISSARLYLMLVDDTLSPRSVFVFQDGNQSVWTWTAAAEINAERTSQSLDIAVRFFEGETHYMMIRGVRPFTKIQLYNIDYRTDPRFERYDSSGWAYSASEQTLLVKMKHRSDTEYIRIFY